MTASAAPKMSDTYAAKLDLELQTISMDAPWEWLAAGWRDLWTRPGLSLLYGAAFALASGLLIALLAYFQLISVVFPLAAGFLLVGPILAIGLYEISRRIENGEQIEGTLLQSIRSKSPAQLGFLGVVILIAFMVWVRLAALLFALFFGLSGFPPLAEVVNMMLFTASGLTFLAIGSAIGAAIAFFIFAISATSVPLLMMKDVDAITAVILSIECVKRNFRPMVLWAWLIALLTAAGIATLFVGLTITFPLVGHATWHAYRSLMKDVA